MPSSDLLGTFGTSAGLTGLRMIQAMGVRNQRAICPNCGAKIHTQPKGLGHITWANSWINVQTGKECPFCGVALTGKVGPDNRAELANGTQTTIGGFVKTRRW